MCVCVCVCVCVRACVRACMCALAQVGMTLLFVILTKNALFRSYSPFAYLLRAHIHNINIPMYIATASART